MAKFDMCAGRVTIDLTALEETLGLATMHAQNNLERALSKVKEERSAAHRAKYNGDNDAHYRGLCHANTARDNLIKAANHLSACIEAEFHVAEAVKRDETITVK